MAIPLCSSKLFCKTWVTDSVHSPQPFALRVGSVGLLPLESCAVLPNVLFELLDAEVLSSRDLFERGLSTSMVAKVCRGIFFDVVLLIVKKYSVVYNYCSS